jgi:deoxyribose-phosphate aldolase
MKRRELAQYLDHTQLKPEARPDQIRALCEEARDHQMASVCVNPVYVPLASKLLADTDVDVCTVIGFPLGATSTAAKVCEAEVALAEGATELDMVMAIGLLKAGDRDAVRGDVGAVAAVAHAHGGLLKVIIETALLTDEEKVTACTLAKEAGADFVKTSTGFAASGAKVEDVALMRETVGPAMGVKAAGGIHTYAEAMAMIEAGATRIGASRSLTILDGAPA